MARSGANSGIRNTQRHYRLSQKTATCASQPLVGRWILWATASSCCIHWRPVSNLWRHLPFRAAAPRQPMFL